MELPERTGKRIGRFLFAVNHNDATHGAGNLFSPSAQFIFIGVTGESVNRFNFSTDGVRFAEDINFLVAAGEPGTERVLGAPADDEDGVAFVLDGVVEVVPDAAGFGHAGGAEDDARLGELVERH